MDLWRTIMAAQCIHSAQPASLHDGQLSQIWQVISPASISMR